MVWITWTLGVILAVFIVVKIALIFIYKKNKYSKVILEGQVVIVTGGTSGIGKETVKELVRQRAKVIFTGRSHTVVQKEVIDPLLTQLRTDQSVGFQRLIKSIESGKWDAKDNFESENLIYRKCDFSDLNQVKEFADWFNSTHTSLDILINNAGSIFGNYNLTKQGIEMTQGLNHFSHYYLTDLLLEKLTKKSNSRIINVSSYASHMKHAAKGTKFNWEEFLNCPKDKYNEFQVYWESKISNVLFGVALQKLFDDKKITTKAVSLHPGSVRTNFTSNLKGWQRLLVRIVHPILWILIRDELSGAQTSLNCATIPIGELKGGEYYSNCNHSKKNINATVENSIEFMRHTQKMFERSFDAKIKHLIF